MATAVFFHAHPDDEVLFTGGSIARAVTEGHRVVLVTATRGEQGFDRSGVGPGAPSLGARREGELRESAARLGVHRCEILGYQDSGMGGDAPEAFSRAPAEEAAERLAAILVEEAADVFVTYDERGIYGHPDHVKVHKVGLRAAQLADSAAVYLATVDRDRVEALLQLAPTFGLVVDDATFGWAIEAGVAGARITTTVDVGDYVETKRHALAAHRTQFPPGGGVVDLPLPVFQVLFGTEWYIELGEPAGGSHPPHRSWFW